MCKRWFLLARTAAALHLHLELRNLGVLRVSRKNIEQHSLATWRLAYDQLIEKGSCAGDDKPDAWRAKHTAAGAFEHLSPLIWGAGTLSQSPAHFNGPSWSTLVGRTGGA